MLSNSILGFFERNTLQKSLKCIKGLRLLSKDHILKLQKKIVLFASFKALKK